MLITAGSIQNIEGLYMGTKEFEYYLDYSDACDRLLQNSIDNIETVRRIFINPKVK